MKPNDMNFFCLSVTRQLNFACERLIPPMFGDWIRQTHLNTTLQKVRILAGIQNVLKLSDYEQGRVGSLVTRLSCYILIW